MASKKTNPLFVIEIFFVLPTAKVIWRQGHGLDSTDWRSRGLNSGHLGTRRAIYPLHATFFNCNNEFIGCLELGVDPDQMVSSRFHSAFPDPLKACKPSIFTYLKIYVDPALYT